MESGQNVERIPYETPTIEDWGTVADLTEVGVTKPGTDFLCGSVPNPPGSPPREDCPS